MAPNTELVLPSIVVGPADLNRLRREVEALNDYLHQASLRQAGQQTAALPKTSRMLEDFMTSNKLNLLQASDRQKVLSFLTAVHTQAPVLHMSFGVDPSAAFTGKIITWLRHNIHPQLLLRIGLQPSIAAGCVVRTANHQYDFSLRRRLLQNQAVLVKRLEGLVGP